jgi:ribosomal protein S18 acetylase RimI-like enzyme
VCSFCQLGLTQTRYVARMWRNTNPSDDEDIVRMCLALNAEDPGPAPVPATNTRQTLEKFRLDPQRGSAVVLEVEGHVCGYALLVSCWSNELGGEVCTIDELYVKPEYRSRQHATQLLEDLTVGKWLPTSAVVALTLEVTPDNARARRLYERLGFRGRNINMRRSLTR